jgi:nitrogen fixation/metabolism regulation signal transduction histidine kinase
MEARTIKRAFIGLLAAAGVLLSLGALFLLSVTAQNSDDFDRLHNVLIAVNIVGAILLLVLLIGNLSRLLRDYRDNVPGARLKARMVGMFVGLAALPLFVVFYFAVQYINRGIDSWFDVEIEDGLGSAIEVVQAVFEVQMRENLSATRKIAEQLATVPERRFVFELSM